MALGTKHVLSGMLAEDSVHCQELCGLTHSSEIINAGAMACESAAIGFQHHLALNIVRQLSIISARSGIRHCCSCVKDKKYTLSY